MCVTVTLCSIVVSLDWCALPSRRSPISFTADMSPAIAALTVASAIRRNFRTPFASFSLAAMRSASAHGFSLSALMPRLPMTYGT